MQTLTIINEIDGEEEFFEEEDDVPYDYGEEDNLDSDDNEFNEDNDLEDDEGDDSSCPACGGSEYMCCNYWIERNS